MSASRIGQGNLSQLGPNQQPVQTVGTTPVVFILPDLLGQDVIALQLIIENGNVTGAWTIDGSNDYLETAWGGVPGKTGGAEHWTPITPAAFPSEFFPAIVAVTAAYPAASGNQCLRSGTKIGWRSLRVTFTPATGASLISVYAVAKASN